MDLIKLLIILYLVPVVMLYKTQKIVYQKDVSEYCRRRVMPSIFLARNAIESTSFILHFSRVELPYSCAISVRTESGSNIIMVSKFNPQTGLAQSCAVNNPELVVYEMGETFGGYWGHLPEKVMKVEEPQPKQYYTLKTTQSILTRETVVNLTIPESFKTYGTTKMTTKKHYVENESSEEDDDSIKVEIPIVDVRGRFVPDQENNGATQDPDVMFDLRYDVTPKPGVVYDTSIIPIVQFDVKKIVNVAGRREEDPDEPRFDLDIVERFTHDKRLTSPHYVSTARLRFKKFRQKMTLNRRRLYFKKNLTKGKLQLPQFSSQIKDYMFPTTKSNNTSDVPSKYHWKTIEELINKLNKTSAHAKERNKSFIKDETLQQIGDMDHNTSIYLKPNLTAYLSSVQTTPTTSKTRSTKHRTISITTPKKIKSLNQDTLAQSNTGHHTLSGLNSLPMPTRQRENSSPTSVNLIVTDTTNRNYLDKDTSVTQKPTKSLVDHESWENVVQAAPDMAVLLNVTDKAKRNIQQESTESMSMGETDYEETKSYKRKRRDIYAIEIENARPYNLTTRYRTKSTTQRSFQLSDMQEFAQLVELQDDDLYGRIALRYIRQYVGPVIFNICEYANTTKKQHVHLFNASRIVLTINNYSHLTGLSLVMTTARALLSGEPRCPGTNIECQVSGARVCIDAMSACDGVPNCGSYDIYDEDRLMCGASEGLQHNVYVAAFTFLAVLLTVLYAVHYWLKRCVPKVADAFFIYTNGSENILYLQPIMRAPHDTGEMSMRLFYHPGLFENDYEHFQAPKISLFRRLMNILFCGLCIRKKKMVTEVISQEETEKSEYLKSDMKNVYSFTQNEIQKMFNPTGNVELKEIQSRDSLETQKMAERRNRLLSVDREDGSKLVLHDSVLTLEDPYPEDYTDELGMLKFFKDQKNIRANSKSSLEIKVINEETNSSIRSDAEKELFNYSYHSPSTSEPGPSNVKTETRRNKNSSRRLRFDEMTTQIPASIVEVDEDEIEESPKESRHSKFFDAMLGRPRKTEQNRTEEDNESLNKEHKLRMTENPKNKKQQKRNF